MALAYDLFCLRQSGRLEAVASAVSGLPSYEIGALVEKLIEIIDARSPDPDLEDSFDQEGIDEREPTDDV